MSIGSLEFFTKEHIEKYRGDTSPILAEQVVHCLELVSQLVDKKLDFMFKGGNSLLVILDTPRRFSIDIDIATDESKEKIEEVVRNIVEDSSLFIRYTKREHKTKPWLPMISFNLFYNSHFTEPSETFIMLDVQLKLSKYPKTKKKVKCMELYFSDVDVVVPTVSSLIGDKLLTLGPATLGIPLGKNKEAQRLKHVFDIATLSLRKPSVDEIRDAIEYCMIQENELQRTSYSLEETFVDTLDYLSSVIKYVEEPEIKNEESYRDEIIRGRLPFAEHLIKREYSWKTLQENLARVAYTFSTIFMKNINLEEIHKNLEITENDAIDKLSAMNIEDKYIKNIERDIPIASFYWQLVIENSNYHFK